MTQTIERDQISFIYYDFDDISEFTSLIFFASGVFPMMQEPQLKFCASVYCVKS